MDPSKRDNVLVAVAAVFAAAALSASLIYRARSSRLDAGVGPGPGGTGPTGYTTGGEAYGPPQVRTDTLEVREVPAPGSTGYERAAAAAGSAEQRGAAEERRPAASAEAARLAALGADESSAARASFDTAAPASAKGAPADPLAAADAPRSDPRSAKAPPAGKARAPKGPPRSSDAGLLDSDARLSGKATDLVKQAKGLTVGVGGGDSVDFSSPRSIQQAIMKQTAIDDAVDADLRKRLDQLGPSADIEQKRAAAADVLAAHGQPAGEQDITNAVGAAMQPAGATSPASAPPGGMDQAVEPTVTPHPPQSNGPMPAPVGPEFHPTGPPPADAMKAYQQYKSAFDEALQKYGVRPEHILAIGEQESGFGKNMGRTPELRAIASRRADLKAAYVLAAQQGTLPAPLPNLRGSPTGAMGPWQFQPATCLSVGCHPYDWPKLIGDSVPKLLTINGYKAGNPASQHRAFCRYYGKCADAHADYANDIDRRAANIKAGLDRLGQAGPVAATAKP